MQRIVFLSMVAGLAASWGCGEIGGGSRRNASGAAGGAGLVAPDQQVVQPAAAPAAPGMPAAADAERERLAAGRSGQPPLGQAGPVIPGLPAPGAAPLQPNLVQEKAQAGVSGKGDYGGPGIVTTPISTYFQVKERLVFEVAIPQAIQLYEATNGFKPKTQDDFMRDIIQANNLKLPALPAGHRYVYDPKKGELMVEHPE